jgi:hypothetical protein
VFPANKDEYGSTEVLLNFKTRGMLDENGELIDPQLSDCEFMITLEAVTYFLGHEQESVMSVAEALQSPLAVLKKTTYKKRRRKMQLKRGVRVARSHEPSGFEYRDENLCLRGRGATGEQFSRETSPSC